ncbi:RNA methyltransferase [Patescibacteria group bacterium]|nr:RNA methyltransferase [Patescibacteria group bacterium]
MKKKPIDKIIIVCHNIRSAFNVGSIFRTADGAGASKIILGGYSAHPPHPKLAKTALGAEKTIPYERIWSTWRAIDELKEQGYQIVALEKCRGAKNIFQFNPKFPLALALGNEVRGLSKEILKRCDEIVFIPMAGKKESLNVSVAFGVGIYQLRNTKTYENTK